MPKSKNCFLCNLSDEIRREIIRQKLLIRSDKKVFNWFQQTYPTAELKESTMVGHIRRHVTDKEKAEITLEPAISSTLSSPDLLPIIVKDGEIIIAPNVELVSLFRLSIKRIKSLFQTAHSDAEADNRLMKWMGESRRLLELIDRTRKLPGAGESGVSKKKPSEDYMSKMTFEEGEYESLQQDDQLEASKTKQ